MAYYLDAYFKQHKNFYSYDSSLLLIRSDKALAIRRRLEMLLNILNCLPVRQMQVLGRSLN